MGRSPSFGDSLQPVRMKRTVNRTITQSPAREVVADVSTSTTRIIRVRPRTPKDVENIATDDGPQADSVAPLQHGDHPRCRHHERRRSRQRPGGPARLE